MFEDSLMESQNRISSPAQRWTPAASLTLQCALVAGTIVLPLLHPDVLPFHIVAPSITLPLKPLPPRVAHIDATTALRHASVPASAPASGTPTPTFTHLQPLGSSTSDEPPSTGAIGPMTGTGNAPDGIGTSPIGTSNRVTLAPAASTGPARISTGVSTGLLLTPIVPVYPRMAISSRTEGIVVVEAVISKTGRIESARATSGPAILRQSALEAIRSARYMPYLLNGAPTEVETTITVNFKLSS